MDITLHLSDHVDVVSAQSCLYQLPMTQVTALPWPKCLATQIMKMHSRKQRHRNELCVWPLSYMSCGPCPQETHVMQPSPSCWGECSWIWTGCTVHLNEYPMSFLANSPQLLSSSPHSSQVHLQMCTWAAEEQKLCQDKCELSATKKTWAPTWTNFLLIITIRCEISFIQGSPTRGYVV